MFSSKFVTFLHLICLAHVCHYICKEITQLQAHNKNVDQLIVEMKDSF